MTRFRTRIGVLLCVLLTLGLPHAVVAKPKSKSVAAPPVVGPDSLRTEFLRSAGQALVGEEAPWLSGWTLEGDVWNISRAFEDSTTRRVALVFFASWCAPCRHGLKLLNERVTDLRQNHVQVVLVNVSEEPEKVRAFLGADLQFTVLMDRYGSSKQTYLRSVEGSIALPQTVLVDRDLRVHAIIGKEGADYVDRLLAGR